MDGHHQQGAWPVSAATLPGQASLIQYLKYTTPGLGLRHGFTPGQRRGRIGGRPLHSEASRTRVRGCATTPNCSLELATRSRTEYGHQP